MTLRPTWQWPAAAWHVALWCAVLATAALWPAALDRWVLPKDLAVGVAALFGTWVAPRGRLPRWTVGVVLAAITIAIIASLTEPMPLSAIFGRWPRYEGIVTASAYFLALWLGARLIGPSPIAAERRSFTTAIGALSILIGAVSVLESWGLRPLPSDLSRPGSLLGNATDQGAIGAACVLLLIIPALRTRRPFLRGSTIVTFCGVGFGLATVLIAASRASLLALIVGLAAIGGREILARTHKKVAVGAVAAALGLLAGLALLSPALGPRLLGGSGFGSSTIGDRILIWGESLHLAVIHPVWGVGPSGFSDAIASVHDSSWFDSIGQSITLDSPHNILVQALMVGGPALLALVIVGIIFLVRAIFAKTRGSGSETDVAVSTAVALLSIVLVLLTHVTSPGTVLLAALLTGSLVSTSASASRGLAGAKASDRRAAFERITSRATPWFRPTVSAVVLCWMFLVATSLSGEIALSDGRIAAFTGDIETATASFARAGALRPWDVDTSITAAEALTARLDKGDKNALRPAVTWSTAALVRAPDSLPAAEASVTAHLAAGDLVQARTTLEHFTALMPQQPWIAHRLAVVMLLEGNLPGAEKQLLHAISLNRTNADPWLTLAYLYTQEGRDLEAANATAQAQSLTR